MLQWLHANRSEGCTAAAMREAIKYGRVPVVEWLFARRSERDFTPATTAAAERGHFDKLRCLSYFRGDAPTDVLRYHYQSTSIAHVHWFYETLPEFCNVELLKTMPHLKQWLRDIGEL